jgi:hypothetical protein
MAKLMHRRWLMVTMLTVLGIVGFLSWMVYDSDPIRPGTFRRLEVGMTRSEVDAILGEAPPIIWHVAGGDAHLFEQVETLGAEPPIATPTVIDAIWTGSTYQAWITFDTDGRLQHGELMRPQELPLWQRFRGWVEDKTRLRL